jgi:protein phosphatase
MEPVVDGAAGDNVGQRQVDPRSAAGRAALADPTPAPAPTSTAQFGPPPRRRRPLRLALVAAGVLLVLVGAGIGFYVWALGHWFVGVDGSGAASRVSVFRGLNASFAGLDLYRVDQPTDLAVRDLTPAARSRVSRGITADSSADAHRILGALREQRLPLCPTTGSGTGAPATDTTPPTDTGAATSAPPGVSPVTGQPTDAVPTGSAPTAGATATATGRPGVDCREAK